MRHEPVLARSALTGGTGSISSRDANFPGNFPVTSIESFPVEPAKPAQESAEVRRCPIRKSCAIGRKKCERRSLSSRARKFAWRNSAHACGLPRTPDG